jgi:hypothetical protein
MAKTRRSFTFAALAFVGSTLAGFGAETGAPFWNAKTLLHPYRLAPPMPGKIPEYLDLDGDGKPDVLRTTLADGTAVEWIDDSRKLKVGDQQGDLSNDCLIVDRNRDGVFGGPGDLIVDGVAKDAAGNPAMQIIVDLPEAGTTHGGTYMTVIDADGDGVFNALDWRTYQLRSWLHAGTSDFFADYHGKSAFLKIHGIPERMSDPRLNWEVPFLFYDPDDDGLTEMAIRMLDSGTQGENQPNPTGHIDWVSLSLDMDNDNGPGNEFDFDLTLHFSGPGFSYRDQVHKNANLRGNPAADSLFKDPRFRQMTELYYPDHDAAWDLIFKKGKWDRVWFTYDEDDDCNRWERVEMYRPLDLFKVGANQGGLDDNPQADPAGDRGEWDQDNSGHGRLYIGRFDGKLHLYGAESGAWRIDQNARAYQGMGGLYDGYGPKRLATDPEIFPTISYTDTDNNGFFDRLDYDLDGDGKFETSVSLPALGLDDRSEIIETSELTYADFTALEKKVSEQIWAGAENAVKLAQKRHLDTAPYARLLRPKSVRQKYDFGFWLQFYLFRDLCDQARAQADLAYVEKLTRAYYEQDWTKAM